MRGGGTPNLDLRFSINFYQKSQIQSRLILGSFDNLAGLKASGADSHSLCAAADESADGLQVGIETTVCAVVGMADTVTKLRPLATYLATLRHGSVPPVTNSL